MQLIPLELVKSNRGSVRKAREAYLIERDQTLQPRGLKMKLLVNNNARLITRADYHVESLTGHCMTR